MKPATEHQLDVTRLIYAPRDKVYAAWTQPEHIKRWWLADSFVDPVIELELRVGGHFRFGMRPEDGEHFYATGTFQAVDPPQRIVHTWKWEGKMEGVDRTETLVTVEFAEKDGSTEIRILHSGFQSAEMAEKHGQGWGACLDRLVKQIA